jgi:hypothetical protein
VLLETVVTVQLEYVMGVLYRLPENNIKWWENPSCQSRKGRVSYRVPSLRPQAVESSIIDGGNPEECIAEGKLRQLTETCQWERHPLAFQEEI